MQKVEKLVLFINKNLFKALALLIKTTRPFLGLVSKAKAAKLVRTLVDLFLDMEAGTGDEVNKFSFILPQNLIIRLLRFHYVKKISNGLKVKIEHFFDKIFK